MLLAATPSRVHDAFLIAAALCIIASVGVLIWWVLKLERRVDEADAERAAHTTAPVGAVATAPVPDTTNHLDDTVGIDRRVAEKFMNEPTQPLHQLGAVYVPRHDLDDPLQRRMWAALEGHPGPTVDDIP